MANSDKLELICETATGYNNIDVEYAKDRNIAVTNVAGYSTPTVAQHTFATLLHLYDKIAYYDNFVKSGEYSKSGMFTNLDKPYNDIEGKVWGIIGLGAIGKKVAKIADAFGAKVVYYSTSGINTNSDYKRVELEE
jgi:glycerate dehydrogenase